MELLIPAQVAAMANRGHFMPTPSAVAELLADAALRQKRLEQILAENGSLPDWCVEAVDEAADADDELPRRRRNRQ